MYRAWNRHRALLTRFLNIESIGFQWILQAGRWMLMRLTMLPGTNYVIHKAIVEQLGGWDQQALTEDAELSIRIYQAGYQIQLVPASVSWEQEPEHLKNLVPAAPPLGSRLQLRLRETCGKSPAHAPPPPWH